jgi:phosphomannomutase
MVKAQRAVGGVITASHNPPVFNGLNKAHYGGSAEPQFARRSKIVRPKSRPGFEPRPGGQITGLSSSGSARHYQAIKKLVDFRSSRSRSSACPTLYGAAWLFDELLAGTTCRSQRLTANTTRFWRN